MDAAQLRQLEPKLERFLERFSACFARKDTRAHLGVYVRGQLSNLPEKSVEPIALEAGVAPRTLQEFLSQLKWDEDRLRNRMHELVRTTHSGPHTIGFFDETSDPKKGDKTPGVQKQWCGRLGKVDNCLVTVRRKRSCTHFHCLLDGELFLPESWAADRERCREAGIPETMDYRPKWRIALELYDRAVSNDLHFDWLTFDEGYGSKPEFLREVTARKQHYVAEVPRSLTGWLKAPRVITRPFHRGGRGRGRKVPRLASGSRRARDVAAWLDDPVLSAQPWRRWRVKDGEKGPLVWETKHTFLTVKDEQGLPGARLHLLIARNVLNLAEVKFFVSNAPPATGVGTLLHVAFSRWRVERCFEDQKSEIGLDQYEGRRYLGLKRHLLISALSYLFLAQARQEWGEKPGVDGVPTAYGNGRPGALLVGQRPAGLGAAAGKDRQEDHHDPATQGRGPQEPHQDDATKVKEVRHPTHRSATMRLGNNLAL